MGFFRWCALAVPFCMSMPAFSQTLLTPNQLTMRPIVERNAQGFDICGINVIATMTAGDRLERHEFLLVTSASTLQGTVKAGRTTLPISQIDMRPLIFQPKLPGPSGFWLASAVEGKAMRTKVVRQAPDDAGYLLGAVNLPSAHDQLEHFIAGKKMQFGIEYGAGQDQYAFSFSDKMALSDRSDLLACLQGQTELMRELHKNMLKQ